MSHASMPAFEPDEQARLDAVRRYDILDTPPDGAFDRITQLAARFCRAPISTITIVDHDRIWFKSAQGIAVDQIGRDPGLCASAVMQLDPYIVTDASLDPRTLDNPLVCGDLGLRFYVGVPLTTASGHNLGTLNVIDVEPREITEDELATLHDLAAVVMDELELRLAARERVELEMVREADRLRDAIVAGLTHEMRTPLAILQGLASLEDANNPMTPEDLANVRRVRRRQLRHLDWLVQHFLDYASLEGDQPPHVEAAAVDMRPILEDAAEMFGDHPLDLRYDDELPLAHVDEVRTRQIVLELLNNATRFGAGRPVTVAVTHDPTGWLRVAVTDQGPGIPPDDRERVFEKGFRGDTSTGTGLGLYVARTFADAQGARIEIDSADGGGATVTLVAPTAQRAGPTGAADG